MALDAAQLTIRMISTYFPLVGSIRTSAARLLNFQSKYGIRICIVLSFRNRNTAGRNSCLIDRLGIYFKLFVSTVRPSSHECATQFDLANFFW